MQDNVFPGTCLKDTERSFQGSKLIRPLHKSQGLTLNHKFKRGFMVSQNFSTGRACRLAPGFVEVGRVARELKGQLALDPDSERGVQCFSLTLNSHPLPYFSHQQKEASLSLSWEMAASFILWESLSFKFGKNKFENV